MTSSKPHSSSAERGEPVRQRVLDAAERLLRSGKAGFSMRELAAEAGVSFATPFNQLGSKAGIMHALSERRIETMTARFADAIRPPNVAGRVRLAVATAVAIMLEEPDVNRAVMSWIGTAATAPGNALVRSTAYWALALNAECVAEQGRSEKTSDLSRQLALGFRGALSFWTAGELSDQELGTCALAIANTLALAVDER